MPYTKVVGRLKDDHGKPRFDLIDPQFELDLATVLAHGAEKYKADSWKQVEIEAYYGAIRRHVNAIMAGEYIDPGSGLPHTAHISANAMFISYLAREKYKPKCQEQFKIWIDEAGTATKAAYDALSNINPIDIECDDYDSDLRRDATPSHNINPVASKCGKDGMRHNPETAVKRSDFKGANESVTSKVPDRRGTHQRF